MRIFKWITIWTLVCTGVGFSQTMATLALPDTSAAFGDTVAIPITVSTDSIIGLAQFVVEFDSSIIQFQNAVVGKDVVGFTLIQNPNLPFATTTSGTNDNVLIQVSGGGPNTVSGQGKEMARLKFAVVSNSGNSPLSFDQTVNHTYLTTPELKDIAGSNINFVDGSLEIVPTNVRPGETIAAPSSLILYQNYPNPFNPETRIEYELPRPAKVIIKVVNLLGQEVRTLVDRDKPAGYFEVLWDGKDNEGHRVSSGVYLYRMEAGDFVQIKRMLLLQ